MNGAEIKKLGERVKVLEDEINARDKEIKDMKAQITALEKYVNERKQQQLTYPLDNPSQQIIQTFT